MRVSQFFISTYKEAPAEAELAKSQANDASWPHKKTWKWVIYMDATGFESLT